MHVFDENYLQLIRRLDVEEQADGRFAFALPVLDLQAHQVSAAGGELGRVPPQLFVFEFLAVPQPHHQRRPNGLPLAAERLGDETVGLPRDVFLAAVL